MAGGTITALLVPQGKIVDFIDSTFRNETPEEYVRQEIEKSVVSSTLAFRRNARWRSAWESNWQLEFSHFGCMSRHAKTSAALPATSARWRHIEQS